MYVDNPSLEGLAWIQKLTAAERAAALQDLAGWQLVEGRDAIERSFKFTNFNEAWGFMNRVALMAEKADRTIRNGSNVYNRVDILLTTQRLQRPAASGT